MRGKYTENWQVIKDDKIDVFVHGLQERIAKFLITSTERRNLKWNEIFGVTAEIKGTNSLTQVEKISGRLFRMSHSDSVTFPLWRTRGRRSVVPDPLSPFLDKWDLTEDNVKLPRSLFSGSCFDRDVNFVGSIFETFPDIGLKDP